MSSGINVETQWPSGSDEEPETPLAAQSLRTWVDRTDAFPSLMIEDGERKVEVSTAIGSRAEAATRLTKLASTALALALELKPE